MTSWGGSQYAWGSPTIIGLGIAAVVLAALFVWWERRAEDPLIPPRLFSQPRVRRRQRRPASSSASAMFGALTFLPLYLQVVRGASPTESGLLLVPLMAGLLDGVDPVRALDQQATGATACSRSPARRSSRSA